MTFQDWWKDNTGDDYTPFKLVAQQVWRDCEKETAAACIEICARRYAEYLNAESDCGRCDSITHCGECVANEIMHKFNMEV